MYDPTAVRFADRVLNAGRLQVERVIVRERQQVETERLERIERLGRREKPTALARGLARQGHGRLEIREHDVAFEQSLDHRDGLWRGGTDVGSDHRLTRQRDRQGAGRRRLREHRRARSRQDRDGACRRRQHAAGFRHQSH